MTIISSSESCISSFVTFSLFFVISLFFISSFSIFLNIVFSALAAIDIYLTMSIDSYRYRWIKNKFYIGFIYILDLTHGAIFQLYKMNKKNIFIFIFIFVHVFRVLFISFFYLFFCAVFLLCLWCVCVF